MNYLVGGAFQIEVRIRENIIIFTTANYNVCYEAGFIPKNLRLSKSSLYKSEIMDLKFIVIMGIFYYGKGYRSI